MHSGLPDSTAASGWAHSGKSVGGQGGARLGSAFGFRLREYVCVGGAQRESLVLWGIQGKPSAEPSRAYHLGEAEASKPGSGPAC